MLTPRFAVWLSHRSLQPRTIPAEILQMTTNIGDDGRQVISGLTTTLHAFAHDAVGQVSWYWSLEGGCDRGDTK